MKGRLEALVTSNQQLAASNQLLMARLEFFINGDIGGNCGNGSNGGNDDNDGSAK